MVFDGKISIRLSDFCPNKRGHLSAAEVDKIFKQIPFKVILLAVVIFSIETIFLSCPKLISKGFRVMATISSSAQTSSAPPTAPTASLTASQRSQGEVAREPSTSTQRADDQTVVQISVDGKKFAQQELGSAAELSAMAEKPILVTGSNTLPTITSNTTGHALLLKRLFHTDAANANPPVRTSFSRNDPCVNDCETLTLSDRKMLEDAYEYATNNGIDLVNVDNLAFDLATYRFQSLTGGNFEAKDGMMWNTDGSPLFMRMNAQDTESAKRILTSQAINNTTLDKDFLAFALNPRAIGWSDSTNRPHHAVDYAFLEKMISVFSSSGAAAQSSAPTAQENMASQALPAPPFDHVLALINRQDEPLLPPSGWKDPTIPVSTPLDSLSASDKNTLIQAFIHALHQGQSDEISRLKDIASMLNLPLINQHAEILGRSTNHKYTLDIANNLISFVQGMGSQKKFSATDFLEYVLSSRITEQSRI
jgi:hypothetical protein